MNNNCDDSLNKSKLIKIRLESFNIYRGFNDIAKHSLLHLLVLRLVNNN